MPSIETPGRRTPSQGRSRHEPIVARFESAWRQGRLPTIDEYLLSTDVDRSTLLVELVQIDLRFRLERGEDVRVESYLSRYADLVVGPGTVLALILSEFELRRARDAGVSPGEYLERFPGLRAELAGRLGDPDHDEFSDFIVPTTAPHDPLQTRYLTSEPVAATDGPEVPGYEILGVLGRGGMGVVYKARQTALKRVVALKMILGASPAGSRELQRFQAEAEAIARLQHPNIVQVYEVGSHQGRPYFSLEFVDGLPLNKLLRDAHQTESAAARLAETLARAMHAAHERGIVHRDLKPGNVLLTADGIPKIADFGLAKHLEQEGGHTVTGEIMGTPSYMAPEQAEGLTHLVGPAADIYAIGGILYVMLTGVPPFRGATMYEILEQVRTADVVPPSRLRPGLSRDLETICLKCLEKPTAARYATALALADDLRRQQAGEPIRARPTGHVERLVKWVRRHPLRAALAAVSGLAIVAAVGAILFYGLYQDHLATTYRQRLELRDKVDRHVVQASAHESNGRLQEARYELTRALTALESEPELDAKRHEDVSRHLARIDAILAQQQSGQEARNRWPTFQKHRYDALFHETLFTGFEVAANRARTRESARAALALVGFADSATDRAAWLTHIAGERARLAPDDQAELVQGCHELLLVWAEVEVKSGGTEVPAACARALHLLDAAERLGAAHGLASLVLPARKARYQALRDGQPPPKVAELQAPPTLALDWFLIGLEKFEQGDVEAARAACGEALSRQPRHYWARYVQALCHLRQRNWIEAKAGLTICLDTGPALAMTRVLRAFAAGELAVTLKNAAEVKAAEADFHAALDNQKDPLVRYSALVSRGALFRRLGRLPEALRDLREATTLHPGDVQGLLNLGQVYLALKQGDRALAALDQAIARKRDLGLLFETRGEVHLLLRDLVAARSDFDQAARQQTDDKSPRLPGTLVKLAKVYQDAQEFTAAEECCQKAIALRPDFALAHCLLAESLLAQEDHAAAAMALDRYLQLAPRPSAEYYHARGLLHAQAGQYSRALPMYTMALKADPANVKLRLLRGWTYLLADAPGLAFEDFDLCLREQPGNADALCGRGRAGVRMNRIGSALADAATAEKLPNLTDRLHYHLACLYAQLSLCTESGATNLPPSAHASLCEDKGARQLVLALEKLKADKRPAFWRSQVQAEPVLNPLRRTRAFAALEARYK